MFKLDSDLRAARMLAAGRLTATFTSERTGQHITVSVRCRKNVEGQWVAADAATAMVAFFTVPNESGFGDKIGRVTRSRGFIADPQADPARVYCAKALLHWVAGGTLPAGLTVAEEERCGRCGRQLTDPVSIARGIGPECFGRETGSKHQSKERPTPAAPRPTRNAGSQVRQALAAAHAAAATGDAAATGRAVRTLEAAERLSRPSSQAPTDRAGVPLATGGWRARKALATEILDSAPEPPAESGYNRTDLYPDGIPY